MAKIDQIVSPSARAVPADAIVPAIARGPERVGIHDKDPGPIDDCSTAKVVSIGQGTFGVIWNGRLRWEKYSNKGFAYLAVAALRANVEPSTPSCCDRHCSLRAENQRGTFHASQFQLR
jgi:hypothetical protein